MCTAATYKTKDFYFGRTLDYDFSYGHEIAITPRNYSFDFRDKGKQTSHYAMIGMAYVCDNTPLYYDAVNEKGLGMAGLNFVGNAVYREKKEDKDNIATFELIPWLLSRCATVREAKQALSGINIWDISFRDSLPPAQLHWIIADSREAITVESVEEGIHIYDNLVGILANNPPFDIQMFSLNNFRHLSAKNPPDTFSSTLDLKEYSRGMGAIGLPGDVSSQSRFIRASFVKLNSISGDTEQESVNQFFHILNSVEQPRGCCETEPDEYEITFYTSCCNTQKGIYYYTTYDNHQISAVDMHKEELNADELIRYSLPEGEQIRFVN